MRRAQNEIRGTEWEDIIFDRSAKLADQRALEKFRKEVAERDESISETNEMILADNIPHDELWALRNRIKDLKETIPQMAPEDRLPVMKDFMAIHDQIFDIQKNRHTKKIIISHEPDDAA